MIEQFTPQRPDESLDEGILPGTSIARTYFLDARVLKECLYTVAINAVVIAEQATSSNAKKNVIAYLKSCQTV